MFRLHYLFTPQFLFDSGEPAGGGGGTGEPSGDPNPAGGAPDPAAGGEPSGQTVPLDQLLKERKARQSLQSEIDSLRAAADEARKKELSEIERLKEDNQKLNGQVETLTSAATRREREGLIRDAAAAAKFIDAQDAISLIGTDDVEDAAAAKQAVEKLAKAKPHLVQADTPTTPGARKVLERGERVDPAKGGDDASTFSAEELKAMSAQQYAEIWATQAGRAKIQRSMSAVAAAS